MPKWPAYLMAAGAAACAYPALTTEPPAESGGAPASYRALGTEPFWSATLEGGNLIYENAEGVRIVAPRPMHRTTFNGHRYESPRITLDITHSPCSDGMSNAFYPHTVRLMVDGRELSGCGFEPRPAADLAGTSWRIAGIQGEEVPGGVQGERYRIAFEDGRLSGIAGCNRFNGPFRTEGERLAAGPIASTRMACAEPAMTHERFVLGLLSGPVRVIYQPDRAVILSGEQGWVRLER